MFIEVVSQIYRMLVPIIPWLHFLYDQPKSGRLIFAAILVIIYLFLKVSSVMIPFEIMNLLNCVSLGNNSEIV